MIAPDMLKAAKEMQCRPIIGNERAWIEFIRLLSHDSDPKPTLARIQALRLALGSRDHGRYSP